MSFLNKAWDKLGRDNVFFMAAGLAFSVMTTLIPLIVLAFAGLGYALASSEAATREVLGAVRRFLPFASEEIVGSLVAVVNSRNTVGVIGLIGLVWAATAVVSSIRTVVNTVFEFQETRSIIGGKVFDLVMVFVLGIFFLTSVGFTAIFAVVQDFGVQVLDDVGLPTGWVGPVSTLTIAFLINVTMFTLLYRLAPARPIPLWTALAGGIITSILFETAKHAFRWYVSLARQGTLGPASGSLGALILLLLWIYYSGLVFIVGAEAAFALDRRRADWLDRIDKRRRHAIDHATALVHPERKGSASSGGKEAPVEPPREDKFVARR